MANELLKETSALKFCRQDMLLLVAVRTFNRGGYKIFETKTFQISCNPEKIDSLKNLVPGRVFGRSATRNRN